MTTHLESKALARWRKHPDQFIEEICCVPETGKKFVLLPSQREFIRHAFNLTPEGRLPYPTMTWSAPKKSGKSSFASLMLIATSILFGGKFGESYIASNAQHQSEDRILQMCKNIITASPLLRQEATWTASRITFSTGSFIEAVCTDAASVAGSAPLLLVFDEAWGYQQERLRVLFDELALTPTRKISGRLIVSYAGFTGQSELLEEVYTKGVSQPKIGADLYAGDSRLTFWTHDVVAPWQDEAWLAECKATMRASAYQRQICNQFVSSETSFVDPEEIEECTDHSLRPVILDRSLPVFVGLDASTKHDGTAFAVVNWNKADKKLRLIWHSIFQPSPDDPLDFEETVERVLSDLKQRFNVRSVRFDPWQMVSVAQRMEKAGLPMQEWAQSTPHLTEQSQCLFELIRSRSLQLYPDPAIKRVFSQSVAKETSRGWRIGKEFAKHKIDFVVALAMAAHAAVTDAQRSRYNSDLNWVRGPDRETFAKDDYFNRAYRGGESNFIFTPRTI